MLEVTSFALFTERVPRPGVDDPGGEVLTRIGASSTANQRVRKSTAPLVMPTPR